MEPFEMRLATAKPAAKRRNTTMPPEGAAAHSALPAIEPMEARVADELPVDPGWQFEPKWDGFRCVASKQDGKVELKAKSGKSLTRYFPEVVAMLASFEADNLILDGEIAVPEGSVLSFDALQARLHPAESRIRKLARETPAIFVLFDILMLHGKAMWHEPLRARRAALEDFCIRHCGRNGLRLSPATRDVRAAHHWLSHGAGSLDGVVAKRLDEPYRSGERAMLKIKCLRTADCVVGGFRYGENSREIGSLLLGLYNKDGLLDHVGFTSGFAGIDRLWLSRKLKKLKGGEGFTGKAPGGPSRWSTERSGEWQPLKPELVAEVRYDHVTGQRFRHGTKFLRWRPDKDPKQCTFDQLGTEARPSKLIKDVLAS